MHLAAHFEFSACSGDLSARRGLTVTEGREMRSVVCGFRLRPGIWGVPGPVRTGDSLRLARVTVHIEPSAFAGAPLHLGCTFCGAKVDFRRLPFPIAGHWKLSKLQILSGTRFSLTVWLVNRFPPNSGRYSPPETGTLWHWTRRCPPFKPNCRSPGERALVTGSGVGA